MVPALPQRAALSRGVCDEFILELVFLRKSEIVFTMLQIAANDIRYFVLFYHFNFTS